MKTKLTDLKVTEVSFVDRGAIGEEFTVIKAEDENSELVAKFSGNEIVSKLNELPDTEFLGIMKSMLDRFNEINKVEKGGSTTMNEEQVKALITEVVGTAMDTVNKNFVEVNKVLDKIQKSEASEEDKKKAEEEKKKAEETDKVVKAVSDIGEVAKQLTTTFGEIQKGLESVVKLQEDVKKISDLNLEQTLKDINKRVDDIGNKELPSNGQQEDVNKSATETIQKCMWPSFHSSQQSV